MKAVDTTFLIDLEISDSPRHKSALAIFEEWKNERNSFLAIYYQTFLEFMYVVTDGKRFNQPLSMDEAIERCWFWIDQERVQIVYPDEQSLKRAQLWLSAHKLGRKRLQDTHMAAAFLHAGVDRLITANPKDFEIFESFDLIAYAGKNSR